MRSKGDLTGPSPVDHGKPGSKIHAVSERGGLPLHVEISAANTNDHLVFAQLIEGIKPGIIARIARRRVGNWQQQYRFGMNIIRRLQ